VPATGADAALVLQREGRFPGLVNRAPTAAELAAVIATDDDGDIFNNTDQPFNSATDNLLTVFPTLVLFDNRVSNLADERVRGLDLAATVDRPIPIGSMELGLRGTYTFDHDRKLTRTSPEFSLLNEVGKPVDMRLRANLGISGAALGVYLYVNYIDSYRNPYSLVDARMDSWTTADISLLYRAVEGWFRGTNVTFSVQNVTDAAPPAFKNSPLGVRYDSVNASALGRQFSLRLMKHW
jgi:iron complex outermembrane recepter protein